MNNMTGPLSINEYYLILTNMLHVWTISQICREHNMSKACWNALFLFNGPSGSDATDRLLKTAYKAD